jgi:CubicO group peptidase (beta-lactamase class C family)
VARLETRKASPAQPAALPANIRTNDKPGMREGEQPAQEAAGARGRIRNYTRTSVYGFLRLAVEEASAEPFTNYCERSILKPLQLRASGFAEPEEGDRIAIGHSDLGTPLRPSVVQGEFAPGGSVYMSARDLARLVASSMDSSTHAAGAAQDAAAREAIFADDEPERRGCKHKSETRTLPGLGAAIDMVTQADATMAGSLGLALQRIERDDGVCYELRESASGIVCLARWRPHTRDGIVVLCNSATGREAAEHIAHIALGGE